MTVDLFQLLHRMRALCNRSGFKTINRSGGRLACRAILNGLTGEPPVATGFKTSSSQATVMLCINAFRFGDTSFSSWRVYDYGQIEKRFDARALPEDWVRQSCPNAAYEVENGNAGFLGKPNE